MCRCFSTSVTADRMCSDWIQDLYSDWHWVEEVQLVSGALPDTQLGVVSVTGCKTSRSSAAASFIA